MRFDRRVSACLLSGAGGLLLYAQPVAAQSGIELFKQGVCGPKVAPLLTAVYIFIVAGTAALAVFHLGNGLRKMTGSGSQTKQEGRQEAFSSRFAFAAVVVFMSAERIFAFLGLSPVECINLSLP